ncbi:hypothetical protein SPRG_03138 [Saprolegnia parasitica CBS 223.65]|uniref:Uncharacterized protein n=1 Tax=Saprolegnia parasitica (strain CBS 223.65) TaxID=695850 RepID=A0A067CYN8_SAPPC|nr:hypothetical protein SPRG_03138 [Saprolegnia parasitica CBS 223.65]KDO31922.1 hypothetical protein SPRG_03138 [Saprolegnia parasitica CBS 223.65]|eukprot:XP_012197121.1 hypothetical protein SPRG_03138 [Saprolegnia parasitica CBS 223.65]
MHIPMSPPLARQLADNAAPTDVERANKLVFIDGKRGRGGVHWHASCHCCAMKHRTRDCPDLRRALENGTATCSFSLPRFTSYVSTETSRLWCSPCDFCDKRGHRVARCDALRSAIKSRTLPQSYAIPVGLCCAYCARLGLIETDHGVATCALLVEHCCDDLVSPAFVAPKHFVFATSTDPPALRVFERRRNAICSYCGVADHRACVCDLLRRHVGAGCVRPTYRLKRDGGACTTCAHGTLTYVAHASTQCPLQGPDDDDAHVQRKRSAAMVPVKTLTKMQKTQRK